MRERSRRVVLLNEEVNINYYRTINLKMKYISEGARALHKSDLVTLLQSGGVDVKDTNRLPKATLTAILEVLCKVGSLS